MENDNINIKNKNAEIGHRKADEGAPSAFILGRLVAGIQEMRVERERMNGQCVFGIALEEEPKNTKRCETPLNRA